MTESELPTVSVVIATRNRARGLEVCLDHVAGISYAGPWDVVVVDNGSTDDTPAVVQRCAAHWSGRLRYVREERRGAANARNAGVAASTGAIVVMLDDDCYPAPSLLDNLVAEFHDPEVGYVGGRLLLHNPEHARITINESRERLVREPRAWTEGDDVPGTGMALRRAAVDAIGGWDPLFGPGSPLQSGEDIDLHWRLTMAGYRAVYTPLAETWHDHGRLPGDPRLAQLLEDYAISRGAWYAKRLLDGPHRGTTLKAWLWWRIPRQPFRKTVLEVVGAGRYLRLRATTR